MNDKRKLTVCLVLFLIAFAVRIVVWQNNKIEMATVQSVVTQNYINAARSLASGHLATFLGGPNPPSDANAISHPPGYPVLMALVHASIGEGEGFRILQIALNSINPILVLFIAAAVFGQRVGSVAGLLTALAPQFAYHSGVLLPDELSVLPLLLCVYLLVSAGEGNAVRNCLLCGALIGLSCWFRSNALLLPAYFLVPVVWAFPRYLRPVTAIAFIIGFLIVASHITVRNAVVFRAFIPLSLGSGTTFVEGLGDLDSDGTRGLPRTDEDVMRLDETLSGAPPNSFTALYDPNGVERDRARLSYGLQVAAADPGWYLAGVVKRGFSTLRLERVPAMEPSRDERETTAPFLYWIDRPLKLIQRAFTTAVFLPLVLLGIGTSVWRRESQGKMLLLLILPLYYATVQALLHTEYRYVLATPHIWMIFAAVTLCVAWELIGRIIRGTRGADAAGAQ